MGLVRKKQKLIGEHLKSISFCTLSLRNPAIATGRHELAQRRLSANPEGWVPKPFRHDDAPMERVARRSSPAADGYTGRTPKRAKATAAGAGDSAVTIASQLPCSDGIVAL